MTARQVVITGGDGALGRSVVKAFLDEGAVCHLPIHGSVEPSGTDQEQRTGGVDLTDEATVEAYYRGLPPLAASIHLAGGFQAAPLAEISRSALFQQLELNLVTAFLCCREAVKAMRQNGGTGGRIVNVAARVVELPAAGMLAYSVSKAAVAALTRSLAEEVRRDGILVNAVLPSVIDTPANRAAMPKAQFERWPKPLEIARTILWLASPANVLTSGALVPVYGNA